MKAIDLAHRLDAGWVLSQTRDAWLGAWNRLVSQSEFALLYRAVRPFTMCGPARLQGLHRAVREVIVRQVPGSIVECGTARGGSAALMGLTLKQMGARRPLWVFDTFDGIPSPTPDDPDLEIGRLYTGQFRGDLEEVRELFGRLGILGDAHLVRGLFQETLPVTDVASIAVLHLDGDWYESVKVCLDHLYDRVSSGGIIQIDDYGHWEGARKATDEFLQRRGIRTPLGRLDYSGRQLVKD